MLGSRLHRRLPCRGEGAIRRRLRRPRQPRRARSVQARMQEVRRQPSTVALEIWRTAQAVCFDVDSTLIQEESIDALADFMGLGSRVAELTSKAMCGDMKFEDALELRLSVMKPSLSYVRDFLQNRPPTLTSGIAKLVQRLRSKGTVVYLISGGFRNIIEPIADDLDIPKDRIYANQLLFNRDGSYGGFDDTEFTAKSGGKAKAVHVIKATHGYSPMVMIGDGITDLEARTQGAVDLFIGFGGVVERPSVAEQADWFVKDFEELIDALDGHRL